MSVCTAKSFDLTGKIALITGASYGIGFAIATAMANCGATIVFNDIKQELVDKGMAAYKEAGIDAHGYVCDVTNEEAVNAFIKQVTEEVGHINILVNNAGIIKRIPMCEMTAAQFRQVIDVDLNAPFIVSKAVIPDPVQRHRPRLHRHPADRAPARDPARRQPSSLRPVHHRQDPGRPLGRGFRPGRPGRLPGFGGFRLHQRPHPVR